MTETLTKPSRESRAENTGVSCATERALFAVTLMAMPSTVPAEIRIRKLLKLDKRHLDLKCVDVAAVAGDGCNTAASEQRTGRKQGEGR